MIRVLSVFYRIALLTFPREFRHRFGTRMIETFEQYYQDVGAVRSIIAVLEVLWQGMGERLARVVSLLQVPRRNNGLRNPWRGSLGLQIGLMFRDVRFALRGLRRSPLFATMAILILTIGIGATTSIFSVVNALVFRGVPFPEAGRLVRISETYKPDAGAIERRAVSYPDFVDWKHGVTAFSDMGIADFDYVAVTAGGQEPVLVATTFLSPSFFRLLGVRPAIGRLLDDGDDSPGGLVAVVSYDLWRSRWGMDSTLVGQSITVNDRMVTVVGVAEEGFDGTYGGQSLWMPFLAEGEFISNRPFDRVQLRGLRGFVSIARLAPGVSLQESQRQLDVVTSRLQEDGILDVDRGAVVVSFVDDNLGAARQTAFVLAVAASLVLLIACANVANLLIARQLGRSKELALRRAIGAGPGSLVRQLLVEATLLGGIAGVSGAVMAVWLTKVIGATIAPSVPSYVVPTVDVAALLFAIAVSLTTGFVFGLLPAVSTARVSIGDSLRVSSSSVSGSRRGFSTRRALVVAQIAVTIPLLVGSGLMIRSVSNTLSIDTGFDAAGVGVVSVNLPASRYDDVSRIEFSRQLREALLNEPLIRNATVASDIPLNSGYSAMIIELSGPGYVGRDVRVYVHRVSPGYFATLGIQLLQGRVFDSSDRSVGSDVVIVSEKMARRFWPDESPLGRVIGDATIIGVVANATYRGLVPDQEVNPDDPDIFVPLSQSSRADLQVAVRGQGTAADLPMLIQRTIGQIDPMLPVFGASTLAEIVEAQVAPSRAATRQLGAFAAIALLLSAGGLFGIMAFTVSTQTKEIGVRMALGADSTRVLGALLGKAAGLIVGGVVVGLIMALGITRFLESQLYSVSTTDFATYGSAAVVFLCVGLVACVIPSLRATRVDPLVSLRSD